MKKYILFSFLIIIMLEGLNAQILLKKVSLEKQIEQSSLVVEGVVISKKSFWDANHEKIYTVNTVEVFKVFKGETKSILDIITLGGVLDSEAQIVHPSLDLNVNDTGVFTLYDNNLKLGSTSQSNHAKFLPYGSIQGFYKYDYNSDIATNQFNTKQGIESVLYKEIKGKTKSDYTEVATFNIKNKLSKSSGVKLFEVENFSPTTISAGTKSVLTISGDDFGVVKGKVSFRNADNAGDNFIDALDSQVLTWTDTEITVEVPSQAGTGEVRIIRNDGSSFETVNSLTINYAQNNIVTNNIAYQTQLVDDNGDGGYTWQMSAHLAVTNGVEDAFKIALKTWSCETKMNWELDEVNLVTPLNALHKALNDNKNVIAFDNSASSDSGDQLPELVLAQRTSYYVSCSETINGVTGLVWYVKEFDIVFDGDSNWNFTTGAPSNDQYDFQSVALHELGHCRQIDHVIDTNDLMHFSIAKQEVLRDLNSSNITASKIVQDISLSQPICGQSVLINHPGSCTLGIQEEVLSKGVKIYPNPAKQEFFIKSSIGVLDRMEIFDISGRLISQLDLSEASSGDIPINIAGASKGLYLVNIYLENNFITKKLIIK